MPESVVREELESLGIRVQGVMHLRSGHRDRDPTKDRPPTPTSLFQWREGMRCPRCDQSPNSAACECRRSRTWLQRALCNASAASASDTRSETANTRLDASRVGAPTSPGGAPPRGSSLRAVAAEVNTQRTTGAVQSGKRRGRRLQSRRKSEPERMKSQATLPLRKLSRPGPLPSRRT